MDARGCNRSRVSFISRFKRLVGVLFILVLMTTTCYAWSLPFGIPFFSKPSNSELFVDIIQDGITKGKPMTYSLVLENRGDDTLREVHIEDNFGEVGSLQALPPGEEITLQGTTPVLTHSITLNVSAYSGDHLIDQRKIPLKIMSSGGNPSMQGQITVVASNDTAAALLTCNYNLTNTGDEPLTRIKFTDGQGRVRGILPSLQPGETLSLLMNQSSSSLEGSTITATDSNGQEVIASLVITYPSSLVEQSDEPEEPDDKVIEPVVKKTRSSSHSSDPVITTINATDDENTLQYTDDSDGVETVEEISPEPASKDVFASMNLTLTATKTRAYSGENVTYFCYLKNTGTDELSDVEFSCGDKVITAETLHPGDSLSESGSFRVTGPLHLQARGLSKDSKGMENQAVTTLAIDMIEPRLELLVETDNETIHKGQNVAYLVTVMNTGNDRLTNLVVKDGIGSNESLPELATGEAYTWKHDVPIGESISNEIVAQAKSGRGDVLTAKQTQNIHVLRPELKLNVEPDELQSYAGENVKLTWSISNTGEEVLENVTFSVQGTIKCKIKELMPGSSVKTTSEYMAYKNEVLDVTASGWGGLNGGFEVTDRTEVSITTIKPSIKLNVTPSSLMLVPGEKANFTCTITNDGQDRLSDIKLTERRAGTIGDIDVLDIGESKTFQTNILVASHRTMEFSVTGHDGQGHQWSDSENADADLTLAAINLIVEVPCCANVGQKTTIKCTVENQGSVPLYNVIVNSQALGPLGTIDYLPPGQKRIVESNQVLVEDVDDSIMAEGFTTSSESAYDIEKISINVT